MKHEYRALVKSVMDFIYDSCGNDAKGNSRSLDDRLRNIICYIGWLEGNLLEFMTDEQAYIFIDRVKVREAENAADETPIHDEQDGSFY
jgi:hypothetical protein